MSAARAEHQAIWKRAHRPLQPGEDRPISRCEAEGLSKGIACMVHVAALNMCATLRRGVPVGQSYLTRCHLNCSGAAARHLYQEGSPRNATRDNVLHVLIRRLTIDQDARA